jgi:hypothetical protein
MKSALSFSGLGRQVLVPVAVVCQCVACKASHCAGQHSTTTVRIFTGVAVQERYQSSASVLIRAFLTLFTPILTLANTRLRFLCRTYGGLRCRCGLG